MPRLLWLCLAALLCCSRPTLAAMPRVRTLSVTGSVNEVPPYGRVSAVMAQLTLGWDDPPPRLRRVSGAVADPATVARRSPIVVLPAELVRRTLHAAYRAAGVGASDAQIGGVIARSRWAALLPEVNLRGAQYAGLDTVLYDPASGRTTATNRDQFRDTRTLEAKVGWRLDRLVYGGDEPQLEKLRTDRLEIRLKLAHKVVEALLQRHRALVELARWPADTAEADEAALRLAEAEATLDALTAGAFGQRQACPSPCSDPGD